LLGPDVNEEVDLEINAQKIKGVFMSRHQNARQNHNIRTKNQCSEMWQNSYTWEQ